MKYLKYTLLILLSGILLTFQACNSEPAKIDINLEPEYSGRWRTTPCVGQSGAWTNRFTTSWRSLKAL